MSRREQNKEERRRQILAATEKLIREKGGTDFTMRALASEAGVAFVTPFNLFESKGNILTALLQSKLAENREQFEAKSGRKKPLDQLITMAAVSAQAYVADPELFRPLWTAFGNQRDADIRVSTDLGAVIWRPELELAAEAGVMEKGRSLSLLARSLHLMFRGTMWQWAVGEIGSEEFVAQVQFGTVMWLIGAVTPEHRAALEKKRDKLERQLGKLHRVDL